MADTGLPDLDNQPAASRPWGVIAAVVAFVIVGILVFWVAHEKSGDRAHKEVLAAMDKELVEEESAIKGQREKVMELTRQVENLRAAIQSGEAKNGKASITEFHQLVKQQRDERETFTKMAEAYNKKVSEYRNLEQ